MTHRFGARVALLAGLVGAALLGLALLAGCATNPVSGRRELSLVSASGEQTIGRDGFQAVVEQYGVYDDPKVAARVDSVGQRLARVSHLPNLTWHFTVLDDPVVNAFAMPGGYIYFTRGILAHLNSEAQLAGVLGHEIGHVTARHTARQITQQQLAGLGLGLASVVSESFRRYSGAAQQALGLLFLKYSRDDETQADELGVEYATRAGYDPREIPATYAMLKRVSEKAGQQLPAFLSTHPDPGDREARTTALADNAVAGRRDLVVRARPYVEGLEGVVFGNDPRQGFVTGRTFVHPGLDFELDLPSGWSVNNARAAVTAVAPEKRASMQLTLVDAGTRSPAEQVEALRAAGKIAEARGSSESIGGFPAWVGRVAVAGESGATSVLAAAFVRRSAETMLLVVGTSAALGDEDEDRILAAARSLRAISDPARRDVRPDRVHVAGSTAGTFRAAIAALGPQAIDLESTAILNNLEADGPVPAGRLLKVVRTGRAR